ncbi:MAG: hypothetical protein ACREUW_07695 [Burkholderiales bacterium]
MQNPYSPPQTNVKDAETSDSPSLDGLIRLFHRLVIASALIGIFLSVSPWLPLPLSPELYLALDAIGAGALAPSLWHITWWIIQPLWLLAAIGLYTFQRWARWLFVGVYTVSTMASAVGGAVVWLPWEIVLFTITTLMDGAIIALAFLTPLRERFGRANV